jgi:hypothetical protein
MMQTNERGSFDNAMEEFAEEDLPKTCSEPRYRKDSYQLS